MPYGEVSTPYGARPEGSESKLSTYSDGWRILKTIIKLYMNERPLTFFGLIGVVLILLSLLIGLPVVWEFLKTSLVPKFPSAILATGFMITGLLSVAAGLILSTVTRGRREVKRLYYLSIPAVDNQEV